MSITADLPNIRVRFEPEVLEQLQRNAAKNERSVASEVRYIVKQHLEREASKTWYRPSTPSSSIPLLAHTCSEDCHVWLSTEEPSRGEPCQCGEVLWGEND